MPQHTVQLYKLCCAPLPSLAGAGAPLALPAAPTTTLAAIDGSSQAAELMGWDEGVLLHAHQQALRALAGNAAGALCPLPPALAPLSATSSATWCSLAPGAT